jgi:hypothetical protein
MRNLHLAWLPLSLVLTGCAALAARSPVPAGAQGGGRVWEKVETGVLASNTGCSLAYRLTIPTGTKRHGLVVLAPGFWRAPAQMAGLARALAAAGIITATVDFCNTRPWAGRHFQDGLDMVSVARKLGARRVVYAGFSAGALAALIAARQDPDSVGVVALDLVDDAGLGVSLVGGLDKPVIGLVGDPAVCNAENNGLAVFRAVGQARVIRIRGASHCDFESPTDWLCELVCGAPGGSPAIRQWIIALAVSAASAMLGPRGAGHSGSSAPTGSAIMPP